jgi:hypothetical protein
MSQAPDEPGDIFGEKPESGQPSLLVKLILVLLIIALLASLLWPLLWRMAIYYPPRPTPTSTFLQGA